MPPLKDLTGMKFGRLTVIQRAENRGTKTCWKCVCECKKIVVVRGIHLITLHTKSCGCYNSELVTQRNTKHGMRESKLYSVWKSMRQRCYNEKCKDYKDYGSRNITVCDEWNESFEEFMKWALNGAYSNGLSIDRIDNSKGYSPDNCRWVTNKIQQNNKTDNRLITFDNKTMNVTQWSKELGIKSGTIFNRLFKGWSVEKALTTPVKSKK